MLCRLFLLFPVWPLPFYMERPRDQFLHWLLLGRRVYLLLGPRFLIWEVSFYLYFFLHCGFRSSVFWNIRWGPHGQKHLVPWAAFRKRKFPLRMSHALHPIPGLDVCHSAFCPSPTRSLVQPLVGYLVQPLFHEVSGTQLGWGQWVTCLKHKLKEVPTTLVIEINDILTQYF